MSCSLHGHAHAASRQSRALRFAQRTLAAAMLLSTAACGTLDGMSFHVPSFHVPFTKPKQADLTPARASADNLIRLDAAIRSGCDQVDNIERPPGSADAGSSTTPQRWIARTCTGDISYDVVTVQGEDGPTVKVTPVPGPINRPMNSHFIPAMPDTPPPIEGK